MSWQIVPKDLGEMLQNKDVKKSESHGGVASDEENRHARFEEGIHGVIEDLEKIKTTAANVIRQLHCRTQR